MGINLKCVKKRVKEHRWHKHVHSLQNNKQILRLRFIALFREREINTPQTKPN